MREISEVELRISRGEVDDALESLRGVAEPHVIVDRDDYKRT